MQHGTLRGMPDGVLNDVMHRNVAWHAAWSTAWSTAWHGTLRRMCAACMLLDGLVHVPHDLLHVCCMCTVLCSMPLTCPFDAHGMFSSCALHVCCMCNACVWHASVCVLRVCCVYNACVLHACCMVCCMGMLHVCRMVSSSSLACPAGSTRPIDLL